MIKISELKKQFDELYKQASIPKEKPTGHKSPPKDYPEDKKEYGDPANYKYPLDTEEHVRAAWSYINMSRNQKSYSSSEVAAIKARIRRAAQKYNIDIEG